MKRPILTIGLVAALAIVGWIGIRHEGERSLERGIARLDAGLPPGATFSYATAAPHLLTRGASFRAVVYKQDGAVLTMAALDIGGFTGNAATGLGFARIHATGLQYLSPTLNATVSDLRLRGLAMPGHERSAEILPDIASVTLNSGQLANLDLHTSGIQDLQIGTASLNAYGQGHQSNFTLGKLTLQTDTTANTPQLAQILARTGPLHLTLDQWSERNIDIASVLANYNVTQARPFPTGPFPTGPFPTGHVTTTLANLTATTPKSSLSMARFTGTRDVTPTHVTVSVSATGLTTPALLALDARAATGSINAAWTLDRPHAHLHLDHLDIAAPNLAALTLTMDLDQISLSNTALNTARFTQGSVLFTDRGIMNHIIAQAAARQNTTPDALRAAYAQRAQLIGAIDPNLGAVLSFMTQDPNTPTNTHTLLITMNPPTPLPLTQMTTPGTNPMQALQKLGMTVHQK